MLRSLVVALIGVLCLGVLTPARGHEHDLTPALQLARHVELRAQTTNFADLETFGEAALTRNDREGLNRLYHVTWIFLNQGEFDKAALWNARLTERAEALHDGRYRKIAHLNDLTLRYDNGEVGVGAEMRVIADTDRDWFVGAHAARLAAIATMDQDRIGDALKLLTDYEARMPEDEPFADTAHAGLWEVAGIGLLKLNDLNGATSAFRRFEIEYSNPAYPRPDFDTLYNLARMSTQLGDHETASRFYRAHRGLALRTGIDSIIAYDANLCVLTARGRRDWPGVLACVEPFGRDLGAAAWLDAQLLPARAIAYARTGQVEAAQADLSEILRRRAIGQFSEEGPSQVPLVEAEVMFASGRAAEAYERLGQYHRDQALHDTRRFSHGIAQVTGDLKQELDARREQIETERRMIAVVVGSLVMALALLAWLVAQTRRLREARGRAEAASRAKSEFLANMSHEIRTPLNGVVAMADALAREDMSPRQREMAEIVRSSGVSLERLLSDILDSAKIEAGQLTLEPTAFDLAAAVREVAALWRPRTNEKGLTLVVQADPALPPVVTGDAVRIRQVVTNLISNAVKFTHQGGLTLTVAQEDGDQVRITVADTGVGFGADFADRLFGRFQQADGSITRRFGGTGLGLAIARDLVERMGGRIGAQSVPGQGSTFWLTLPLPAAEPPVAATGADSRGVEADERLPDAPLRILLADDHPANRKVVEVLMAATEAVVVSVENGQQAVQAHAEGGFDLILMDMQMPVMDGLTATRAIRAREALSGQVRTPILMLTANAMDEHVQAGVDAGADGHLAKPITADRLFAAIQDAVTAPTLTAEARRLG